MMGSQAAESVKPPMLKEATVRVTAPPPLGWLPLGWLPLGVLSSPPPQAVMLRAMAAAMARARILLSFIFHFLLLKFR